MDRMIRKTAVAPNDVGYEFSAPLATWFGVSNTDVATVLPNIGRFAHPNLGFLG
jgi:hypothetical protein